MMREKEREREREKMLNLQISTFKKIEVLNGVDGDHQH
jgi:hypothetical protein